MVIDNAPSLEPTDEKIEMRTRSFNALRSQMNNDYLWIKSMAESYERQHSLMEYWKWMATPPRTGYRK